MGRCRYTGHRPQSDAERAALRLSALWKVIREPPPGDGGIGVDDQLLDWVARAGTPRNCSLRRR